MARGVLKDHRSRAVLSPVWLAVTLSPVDSDADRSLTVTALKEARRKKNTRGRDFPGAVLYSGLCDVGVGPPAMPIP